MSPFEKLPLDLHLMIVGLLSSIQDFNGYVISSRKVWQLYSAFQSDFITDALKNLMSPTAQSYALAVSCISRLESESSSKDKDGRDRLPFHPRLDTKAVKSLLKDHFNGEIRYFPSDRASLVTMYRLHNRLSRFIGHFSYTALSSTPAFDTIISMSWEHKEERIPNSLPYWAALNNEHEEECYILEHDIETTLSSTEMARLQRAFYAHELYCRAFPARTTKGLSLFSVSQQCALFLAKIPWYQIEEIACVHQYYKSMAGKLFDQFADELIEDILELPGKDIKYNLSGHTSSTVDPQERGRLQASGFTLLSNFLSITVPAYSHGRIFNEQAHAESSFLTSRGAEYFETVLKSSRQPRRNLLRENFKAKRAFISNAVEYLPSSPPYFFFENLEAYDYLPYEDGGLAICN